jgi:hypothetical protein
MIQTLQYNGLIDVKYDKVEHEVTVRAFLPALSMQVQVLFTVISFFIHRKHLI